MWNSLCSTWKSRSDSGEHWKGAPTFVSRQCFPNSGGKGGDCGIQAAKNGVLAKKLEAGIPENK